MLKRIVSLRPSIVVLAASSLMLAACQGEDRAPTPAPVPTPAPTPAVAVAPAPTLDRAGLLQAMDLAASAYAAGDETFDAALVGRRFLVRQAFGCVEGAEASAGGAGVTRSTDGLTLKLEMTPGDWTASPPFPGANGDWEAAEGVWLSWPWLRAETCPAGSGRAAVEEGASRGSPSPQTMGLAGVFDEDGSRLGRRNGRPYAFTMRGEGGLPPVSAPGGYRLVLEGRLVAFSDGRAVRCHASGLDQRPVCLGAVRMERVAFETAEGQLISEWRG